MATCFAYGQTGSGKTHVRVICIMYIALEDFHYVVATGQIDGMFNLYLCAKPLNMYTLVKYRQWCVYI